METIEELKADIIGLISIVKDKQGIETLRDKFKRELDLGEAAEAGALSPSAQRNLAETIEIYRGALEYLGELVDDEGLYIPPDVQLLGDKLGVDVSELMDMDGGGFSKRDRPWGGLSKREKSKKRKKSRRKKSRRKKSSRKKSKRKKSKKHRTRK